MKISVTADSLTSFHKFAFKNLGAGTAAYHYHTSPAVIIEHHSCLVSMAQNSAVSIYLKAPVVKEPGTSKKAEKQARRKLLPII